MKRFALIALALIGCAHGKDLQVGKTYRLLEPRGDISKIALTEGIVPREEVVVTGELSPDGERHPGLIVYVDRINNTTHSDNVSDVLQEVAWVFDGFKWQAVVRCELVGEPGGRCHIEQFGADGRTLQRTYAFCSQADNN